MRVLFYLQPAASIAGLSPSTGAPNPAGEGSLEREMDGPWGPPGIERDLPSSYLAGDQRRGRPRHRTTSP